MLVFPNRMDKTMQKKEAIKLTVCKFFVIVRLKCKQSFKDHVYFEPLCLEAVKSALPYLKDDNPLYQAIDIGVNNIPTYLVNITETDKIQEPITKKISRSQQHYIRRG